ncbi:protein disabled isoform X2 [Danaus plexippus]|uniref:protein disabled isoform X2 n=1 Tax=Danaus plexippus TaxID=13037 RepID=UPI002AB14981|nr:protein disabled isoform X2 [Danaus plexippus]XP_061384147.1 protein disabled isoform X2 [Danaus plexippus]
MFNHKLPTDFPMQTLRKKTSPCKYKNEPGRFLGEGVSFRAKLIGVLEVPEARGDRMCQEALADLKMAIRAAGEHKQRIQVHVAIDGLRLRDDKTGDSLYHHPVHKISFIAQDMTDSRAFGYIFGSPDTGHRFFGIKTDKAASQVVIAMRDLFQVVFELKKKEVEMAKQQLEGKTVSSLARHAAVTATDKAKSVPSGESAKTEGPEGGVAELVDLEQELCSLRRGLTQVEGLTPSTDPFGDSFIVPAQKGLLPPPPRGRAPPRAPFSPSKPSFDLTSDIEPKIDLPDMEIPELPDLREPKTTMVRGGGYDVFTDLDPLGTGRSKPYVDKKLFFQELKNPPKKVLKDLVPTTHSLLSDILPVEKSDYGPPTTMTSLTRHSGGTVAVAKPTQQTFSPNFFTSDPFAETDPFDNTDPFSDTFKDDPFTTMAEFPKISTLRMEEPKNRAKESILDKDSLDVDKNVFNGPLQVSLPPEPTPKSPRLTRQNTDTSTIRQRPTPGRISGEGASPPPPLPPKKTDAAPAPPRPPHEHDDDTPPLPKPARKKEPLADRSTKPRQSSLATSSEDEYLSPAPPPLPAARRLDITLSQLLTLTMDDLAARLRVPAETLSSMTLPQLTDYLRSYVASENEKAHIHVEPLMRPEKEKVMPIIPTTVSEKLVTLAPVSQFRPQFEDNFAPSDSADTFVANFDDFDKKANPTYDKYAAFREIQEQELKAKSILDPIEPEKQEDGELTIIEKLIKTEEQKIEERKELDKSPLKSLDELTINSFNMFRNTVSPKPIDAKIEDIKTVMKNLQIEQQRRSVSPRDNGLPDTKQEDTSDRYAALREITITEPPEDFESIPPEAPKERKKSDEKSDGFDNSDFFDCIDNSSLSFNVEDAFRKSPIVKEKEEEKKVEEKKEDPPIEEIPVRDLQPPTRLSTGSISDVASGSSPDTKGAVVGVVGGLTRLGWTEGWSSDSRESEPRQRRRRTHNRGPSVQTSSSSRDVSPWDEEPPTRLARPPSHRDRGRDSRHNSSGSRECLDSGSGREKEKRDKRGSRERDLNRDGRDSARDRRDSGSGRDRRDVSKERDHRDHREGRDRRDRRSREREKESWNRERTYSRERDYRDSRSRERSKDYRDMDRHRKTRHSYDDGDYSDGCGSGRSSPRERWNERWRRDERNYGSLGWRETRGRRRNELRQAEDSSERRYGCTLGWPGRRSAGGTRRETDREIRDSRESRDSGRDSGRDSRDPRDSGRESGRDSRDPRDSGRDSGRESRDAREPVRDSRDPRRRRREDARTRPRDYRFSNDFSPREREHPSPFDNDFQDTPVPSVKKKTPYATLEGTRLLFEAEDSTASPLSAGSLRREGESPAARFRFDSDSVSPRSMFEDDFTPRAPSIAEEDEGDPAPLRTRPPRDVRKSDSVDIFTRESDPFEGDAFFACTGSDRVARRENWPGDFQGFDNV